MKLLTETSNRKLRKAKQKLKPTENSRQEKPEEKAVSTYWKANGKAIDLNRGKKFQSCGFQSVFIQTLQT